MSEGRDVIPARWSHGRPSLQVCKRYQGFTSTGTIQAKPLRPQVFSRLLRILCTAFLRKQREKYNGTYENKVHIPRWRNMRQLEPVAIHAPMTSFASLGTCEHYATTYHAEETQVASSLWKAV